MKRLFFLMICLGLLLVSPFYLQALEIELIGGLNNLTFHPDRVTAHGQSADSTQFSGYPYGFGYFHLKNDISSIFGFNIHASRDNILKNSISGSIFTDTEFLKVEFGVFAGISDKFETPHTGVMGSLELMYPGVIFMSLNGSSTLGTQFNFASKSSRESFEFKLGFWLPNIIPAFSFSTKNFTGHPEDSSTIYDEIVRYQLGIDIFAKNFPVTFHIDVGYETLKRLYTNGNSNNTDELNAVYTGLEAKFQVTKPLRIIVGFEMPVYSWATQPMKDPANTYSLYKFHGGFSYTFF